MILRSIAKATTVVVAIIFLTLAFTQACTHAFSQQVLTTVKFRVDEVNPEQTGPILAVAAEEFRSAYIKQLARRGDIEFASANSDFQVRVIFNLVPVVCGEGEGQVGGYSVGVLLVSRVSKETIRLDHSIYTSKTLQEAARIAAIGSTKALGMTQGKENLKPSVVATTTIEF